MRLQETLCLIATAMGNPIRIPRPIHTQTYRPLSLPGLVTVCVTNQRTRHRRQASVALTIVHYRGLQGRRAQRG